MTQARLVLTEQSSPRLPQTAKETQRDGGSGAHRAVEVQQGVNYSISGPLLTEGHRPPHGSWITSGKREQQGGSSGT